MKDKKILNIIYVLFILGNLLLTPSLFVLDAYALIMGLIIINHIRWENGQELLYYFVLLFSVMDFTFNLPLFGRLNIYYLHIALFILIVWMLVSFLKKKPNLNPKQLTQNKYLLFLSIFIAYMVISLIWAESKGMAIKYMINYAIMICFMLVVFKFNSNQQKLKETLKILAYTLLPILIIGAIEMTGFRIMPVRNVFSDLGWYVKGPEYLKTIPEVFFYNPNNYGVYLIMAMTFILPFIVYNKNKGLNALFWLMQLGALLNLIFSTSRTAYIVMLLTMVGFMLFFFLMREREKFRKAVAVAMATIIVFYGLSFMPDLTLYYGKFNDTPLVNKLSLMAKKTVQPIAEFEEEGSTSERMTIIIDITKGVITQGHIQGFGVNNTGVYLKKVGNTHGIVNPHSLWFEILGDFGIGIFLYLIFIYLNLLWDLIKVYKESLKTNPYGLTSYTAMSLIAALGGFILTAFAPSSVISFPQMWLLYGLSAAIILRRKTFLQGSTSNHLE
ncbi:O-antigen ligase family protein [Desulfitobacterium sp. AusDCA]|uniref:O-antigen ligase family protein n=1 Tax=Desulfitobacterium sp. AusDCA TaxID=3240383 RepID=UPI003DA774D7